jgi:hypothetical protein
MGVNTYLRSVSRDFDNPLQGICFPRVITRGICIQHLYYINSSICLGPSSSVGIANGYGMDSLGIESPWGRDFVGQVAQLV